MRNKVVLFHGKTSSYGRKNNIAPLALLHISPFLVKDGYEVKIISDCIYDNYMDETIRQCEDSICLGITALTGTQISDGLKISELVKQRYPSLPVVWGGWHPSIMPESTVQDPNADFVVVGQGGRKFYELVKILRDDNRSGLDKIPGLYFKKGGRLAMNTDLPIGDLDDIPPIPYEIVDVEKCLNKTEYGDRTLQYVSSYGCPCRCSFCIEPVVNRRRWAGFSAERVVDDWEYLYKRYNIDSIAVYDSNFFVNKKRVADICNSLIKKNVKIKWGNANGRIPQLARYEEQIWELMEKAGLRMILTGSESGEQGTLDLMDKDADIEDIYKFTRLSKKYNIKVLFSYMSGIPWSNDQKINESRVDQEIKTILKQVDRLITITNRNRFMLFVYTPLPGSKMYEMAKRHGFHEPKTLREWSNLLYNPEDIFQDTANTRKWITKRQTQHITMLEQYIFGMMDIDARAWMSKGIKNKVFQIAFKIAFTAGYLIARVRLRLKIFFLPVDYWIFIKFRKLMRI